MAKKKNETKKEQKKEKTTKQISKGGCKIRKKG